MGGLRLGAALAICALLAVAACGEDGERGAERIEETADDPAPLPEDWRRLTNRRAGFSIGAPPGWRSRPIEDGQGSLLVSPDELATISVLADRTPGGLILPLEEFAARAAQALAGEAAGPDRFRDLLVGRPAPFDHAYEAVAVRARGEQRGSGVSERVLVAVIRREGMASYVAVARENAERRSELADRDTIKRVIRSLRGRPPPPARGS